MSSELSATVEPDLCAGVRTCMVEAPGAFRPDDQGQSVFEPQGTWTDQQLRKAEAMCPMSAITVVESTEITAD